MQILVVGGTRFIGRHTVGLLCAQGHDVTLLNRGLTAPATFAGLPAIHADRRQTDLTKLAPLQRDWDAVIDFSAYFPDDVVRLLDALPGRIGRYVFCSTISVYERPEHYSPVLSEATPLLACTPDEAVSPQMTTYGQRKAECERQIALRHAAGLATVILRPSIVYGEHDYTDRFAYWIARAASDKPFLLPDDGLTITTMTYVKDLAAAFVAATTNPRAVGQAYTVADPEPLCLRDTLHVLGGHLGTRPLERAVPVSTPVIERLGLTAFQDLPIWLPRTHLRFDSVKWRTELASPVTPTRLALAEAADAFLAEGRLPATGLSAAAEADAIAKLDAIRPGGH